MTPYKSKSGKPSGVTGFKIGEDYIVIQFNYSDQYTYSYKSAGSTAIEKMSALAMKQKGLSTFISQHNPEYESHRN